MSFKNTARRDRPFTVGCSSPDAPVAWFGRYRRGKRLHQWEYSSSWNGNDRKVLPFVTSPHGIARSGYRCFHCGTFAWNESDVEFAATMATAWGVDVVRLITAAMEKH